MPLLVPTPNRTTRDLTNDEFDERLQAARQELMDALIRHGVTSMTDFD